MKKITNLMMMALLSVCMGLTSCDDILGEWSRPAPVMPTVNPDVTPEPAINLIATPLTFEVMSATAGNITVNSSTIPSGMQYSLNGGAKKPVTTTAEAIAVQPGDKVAFYGNGTTITEYFSTKTQFDSDVDVKVYGNIMSLVDEEGFADNKNLPANDTFYEIFRNNQKLTDASGLQLPAMTLKPECYYGMFFNCDALTKAPEKLPAESLTSNCYQNMFNGCVALTTAPELPAKNLAVNCYDNMFNSCYVLTTAPELPAETLLANCYQYMFANCKALTATPKLPATTLVYQCYYHMFDGCTSLTKAYVKADFTLGNSECTSMFTSCSASGDLYTDGATSGSPSWADASVVSAWTKHAYE